jgi:hypothetical protein
MRKHLPITFVAALFMVGCAAEASTPAPGGTEAVSFTQHDEATLDVTVASGGETLRVLVTENKGGIVDVTYDFGGPVIAFQVDTLGGNGAFEPSGAPLDAAKSRLLDLLVAELERLPAGDERSRVDDVAYRATTFMQIVPTGEPLASYQFVQEKGWTHISCSCFNQYLGGSDYRTCGRGCSCGGGNGCKGRCGVGCGGWGSVAYTRDCGRHDWGIGSWTAASDDFTFASNNCAGGC